MWVGGYSGWSQGEVAVVGRWVTFKFMRLDELAGVGEACRKGVKAVRASASGNSTSGGRMQDRGGSRRSRSGLQKPPSIPNKNSASQEYRRAPLADGGWHRSHRVW